MKEYKILLVDDHEIIINGIMNALLPRLTRPIINCLLCASVRFLNLLTRGIPIMGSAKSYISV